MAIKKDETLKWYNSNATVKGHFSLFDSNDDASHQSSGHRFDNFTHTNHMLRTHTHHTHIIFDCDYFMVGNWMARHTDTLPSWPFDYCFSVYYWPSSIDSILEWQRECLMNDVPTIQLYSQMWEECSTVNSICVIYRRCNRFGHRPMSQLSSSRPLHNSQHNIIAQMIYRISCQRRLWFWFWVSECSCRCPNVVITVWH